MCEKNTFRKNTAMDLGFHLFVTTKDTFIGNSVYTYLAAGIVPANNLRIFGIFGKNISCPTAASR
jgi:hypothetical protein